MNESNETGTPLSPEMKKQKIQEKMREILEILGLDLTNPSLAKSPERIATMYVDEIFQGLDPQNFPKISLQKENVPEELVIVKNISLVSFCEHHFVPMMGVAHVAYLPKGQILGLSKVHHIVRHFASRPQLQERLTAQIADSLTSILKTETVAVSIYAKHLCVLARGVKDSSSEMETHILRGLFKTDPELKKELLARLHD